MNIRRATEQDATPISALITATANERIYTAIDTAWNPDEQRQYIATLSARDAIFIAETEDRRLAGVQTLEQWSPSLTSMSHVAQIGTFIAKAHRRQSIGQALFQETISFARCASYQKLIAQVRASNSPALAFYEKLGFRPAGRLTRQVIIDNTPDDEILLELFL